MPGWWISLLILKVSKVKIKLPSFVVYQSSLSLANMGIHGYYWVSSQIPDEERLQACVFFVSQSGLCTHPLLVLTMPDFVLCSSSIRPRLASSWVLELASLLCVVVILLHCLVIWPQPLLCLFGFALFNNCALAFVVTKARSFTESFQKLWQNGRSYWQRKHLNSCYWKQRARLQVLQA